MTKRHLIVIHSEHVAAFEVGSKRTAILKAGNVIVERGDLVSIRKRVKGERKASHIVLGLGKVEFVDNLMIDKRPDRVVMCVNGVEISTKEREAIARREGFRSALLLCDWAFKKHGLPFYGRLIEWNRLP